MYETITLLYRYNSWAMEILFGALEKLSPDQYNEPGCSGHGSIKQTLAHLLSVQWGWFSWFDGSMPLEKAKALEVSENDVNSLEWARNKWRDIDNRCGLFLEIQADESLRVHRSFTTRNGMTLSLPLGEMLLHVVNHGTHTRAQIVAAIRRAGISPGSYDLLHYLLTNKAANVS
jgi:uncharacterized damage-inducible protein DinB